MIHVLVKSMSYEPSSLGGLLRRTKKVQNFDIQLIVRNIMGSNSKAYIRSTIQDPLTKKLQKYM